MNKNLNLVEILKDAPKGTKLWSPICGECEFIKVDNDEPVSILCCANNLYRSFLPDGKVLYRGECVLFPSKDNRDWSTFKVPKQHKHFEPFQKVLVAVSYFKDDSYTDKMWCADLYSHYDEKSHTHYLAGYSVTTDEEVIAYEGNEDKLGKLVE